MFRVVADDIESPYKIAPDIFDFCCGCERFYSTPLTWRPPWCLLCVFVIWTRPECTTTSESLCDVIEQLRAGSPEFVDWLNSDIHRQISFIY